MSLPRLLARARRPIRRPLRDKRGISAVEFAMLLPLMVTLYLGGVEVSQAVAIDRKVTLIARSLGDLIAQAPWASIFTLDTVIFSLLSWYGTITAALAARMLLISALVTFVGRRNREQRQREYGVRRAGRTPSRTASSR